MVAGSINSCGCAAAVCEAVGAGAGPPAPVCAGRTPGSLRKAFTARQNILDPIPLVVAQGIASACTKARRFWRVIEITADPDDPKRTTRVSMEHARQQIAAYGRDNPWVKVRVFGEFPPASLNSLIGPDEVSAAMRRRYSAHQIGNAAKIIGVDVARFGDDESALAFRQGIQAFPFKTYRNLNSTQGAGLVARAWEEYGAHACFVDDTGGFGAGWIDGLRRLGRSPIGVGFAAKPNDGRYFNKRAEMAFECVQWIRRGGALPESANLLTALTADDLHVSGRQAVARAEGGPQGAHRLLARRVRCADSHLRPTGDDGSRTAPQNGGGVQPLCRRGRKSPSELQL